jgi:hypothetical protein
MRRQKPAIDLWSALSTTVLGLLHLVQQPLPFPPWDVVLLLDGISPFLIAACMGGFLLRCVPQRIRRIGPARA